jgi:hypothetical protein
MGAVVCLGRPICLWWISARATGWLAGTVLSILLVSKNLRRSIHRFRPAAGYNKFRGEHGAGGYQQLAMPILARWP